MVVGLLGILKAGGAYLPLDPNLPQERLAFMLKDTAVPVLLTHAAAAERLPAHRSQEVWLDEDWPVIGQEAVSVPEVKAEAENLAYVIYTSGSTGKPKAVAAMHRGVVNRWVAQAGVGGYEEQDICCQKTAIGFVDAVFETLGPLLSGRELVVVGSAEARDSGALVERIGQEGVTRLVTVPSLARGLLRMGRAAEHLAEVRHWTLSGEELRTELLRELQKTLPGCRFVNLYGSSEVAADATGEVCGDEAGERVTIGRPLANTQVYVLDEAAASSAGGCVVGELYIGGAGWREAI